MIRALLLGLLLSTSALAADAPEPSPRAPSAGGRLAWLFSDELDLVGDLYVERPFATGARGGWFVSTEARTAIRKASSLTFDVRDLGYLAEAGGRHDLTPRLSLAGSAGQWGRESADADGSRFVRYVAAALEPARPDRRARFEGRLLAGVVVDDRSIDAVGLVRGRFAFRFPRARHAFGADGRLEALVGGADAEFDLEIGPRLELLLDGPPVASFYLHYVRARTPLGLETTGAAIGFEYTDAPSGGSGPEPPAIDGSLSAGGGDDGRGSARLDLRVLSPPFWSRRARVEGEFDLNLLTGSDLDELWYVYRVGLVADAGGAVAGVEFEHRSNHRLSDPGSFVTSVNVLQGRIETAGYSREPEARRGCVDALARVGVMGDTDFGDPGDLHASAGARYVFPGTRMRAAPFLFAEVEDGQVGRRLYGAGAGLPGDSEIRLFYLSDEQFYGRDKTAILLTGSLRF